MTAGANPTWARIIKDAVDRGTFKLRVAVPCRVEAVNVDDNSVDVKPLITEQPLQGEAPQSVPVVTDVPICIWSGGGFFSSFPAAKGDEGIALVCDRAIDRWLGGDGSEVDAFFRRHHNISDAVFLPGGQAYARAFKDVHAKNAVWGKDGGVQIHLTPDGLICLGSKDPADALALAGKVDTEIANLQAQIDALLATVGANAGVYNSFAAHAGPPASVFAIPAPGTPGNPVGSKVVKSD